MNDKEKLHFGIIVFPGTNCEKETQYVLSDVLGQRSDLIWHNESELQKEYDGLILPGGFSFGDHLRTGAIARFSPVMARVEEYAQKGKPVVGICNGFQTLCEAGLLPGVLMKNTTVTFVSRWVDVRVENYSIFTRKCNPSQVLRMPIAHGDGNFFAYPNEIKELEEHGQVILRYCDSVGNVTNESNPNGSVNNIAGIVNKAGNVVGLMPHPERASEEALGGSDGRVLFESLIHSIQLSKSRQV